MEKKVLDVDGVKHSLHVYTERRNSVRVSLTRRGINLRVPRHLRKSERDEQVRKMLRWAVDKLRISPPEREVVKTYRHGDYLRTNRRIYKLDVSVDDRQKNFAKIKDNKILFRIKSSVSESESQVYMSKKIRKLLAEDNHDFLLRRVKELNKQHFSLEVKSVRWKYTRSRWGVCKVKEKTIELSTKLLLAPLEVLDYVIIHELAHLIEANHSRKYWNIVRSVDAHYKDKITWLKRHGKTLVF